jgi:hypothetical protein
MLVAAMVVAPVATAAKKPRVTVIGDSVQASFTYVPAARARLAKGLDLRVDALVCRRLVAPSCTYQGVTPPPALDVVRASTGARLGRVVVINVGYNDDPSVYDVGAVVKALHAKGVRRIVWVTLHDPGARYAGDNAIIRRVGARGKGFTIADWAAVSAGRPWFAEDGIHLNRDGAMALAGLLRSTVLRVL